MITHVKFTVTASTLAHILSTEYQIKPGASVKLCHGTSKRWLSQRVASFTLDNAALSDVVAHAYGIKPDYIVFDGQVDIVAGEIHAVDIEVFVNTDLAGAKRIERRAKALAAELLLIKAIKDEFKDEFEADQ